MAAFWALFFLFAWGCLRADGLVRHMRGWLQDTSPWMDPFPLIGKLDLSMADDGADHRLHLAACRSRCDHRPLEPGTSGAQAFGQLFLGGALHRGRGRRGILRGRIRRSRSLRP